MTASSPEEAGVPEVVVPWAQMRPVRPCRRCGREWGTGIYFQFCGQVEGLPSGVLLAHARRRLAGYLLDVVLMVVTLIIGWLIWSLIVWSRGTTPGKQLLGLRCVDLSDSERANWWCMALREVVGKYILMNLIGLVTFGIGPLVLYFQLLWTKNRQELWDFAADTIVVHDPSNALSHTEVIATPSSPAPAVPA